MLCQCSLKLGPVALLSAGFELHPPCLHLQQALQEVFTCPGRVHHLWQLESWITAMHTRPDRRQQDAAEFLLHLGPKLFSRVDLGCWEARLAPLAPACFRRSSMRAPASPCSHLLTAGTDSIVLIKCTPLPRQMGLRNCWCFRLLGLVT